MDYSEILDILRNILSEMLDADKDEITGERTFDELGADEIDMVELQFAIEEEFDFEVEEDAYAALTTVDELVKYILDNI